MGSRALPEGQLGDYGKARAHAWRWRAPSVLFVLRTVVGRSTDAHQFPLRGRFHLRYLHLELRRAFARAPAAIRDEEGGSQDATRELHAALDRESPLRIRH